VKTTILEGPDGRLYEIPNDALAEYAVPGEKVAEIRARMAGGQAAANDESLHAAAPSGDLPPGHYRPGELPPGHEGEPPAGLPEISAQANAQGGVTLNFFFSGGPPPAVNMSAAYPPQDSGVEGYHMSFDEQGIPVNHTEMLWGDYIDKQGNPAVGFHSHDPATGNAQ